MLRSPSLATCYNDRHATHQSNATVPAPQLSKDFDLSQLLYQQANSYILPDFFSIPLPDHFIFDAKLTKMYVDEYQLGTELWLGETYSTQVERSLVPVYVAGFMPNYMVFVLLVSETACCSYCLCTLSHCNLCTL